ncbi:MAG: hypothetical protein KDK78_01230 [Chlamydiia bacterium]|nr:hypothetical protein [Chlamydiia bacterium]
MAKLSDRLRMALTEDAPEDPKVISIEDLQEAEAFADDLEEMFGELADMLSQGPEIEEPLHALYIEANRVMALMQLMLHVDEDFQKHSKKANKILDEWFVKDPEVQAILLSHLNPYLSCDLPIGRGTETLASLFLELGDLYPIEDIVLEAVANLSQSYHSLFEIEAIGPEGLIRLRDIVLGRTVQVAWILADQPQVGRIVLARLLPPIRAFEFDYWVCMTSPIYFLQTTAEGWQKRLSKKGVMGGDISAEQQLATVMKRDFHIDWWLRQLIEKVRSENFALYYRGYPASFGR